MTDYKLQENDVRLLRRMQVCTHCNDMKGAMRIEGYLKAKGLKFLLPREQTQESIEKKLRAYPSNEAYLIRKYGAVWLTKPYREFIFLNSKWLNPHTLYVRLVNEVPELGEYGKKYYIPRGYEGNYTQAAEKEHAEYRKYFEPPPSLMAPVRRRQVENTLVRRPSPPLPAKVTVWDKVRAFFVRLWRKLRGSIH